MEGTLTIGFTGDVMIGRLVSENLQFVPPEYLWGNTLPIFHSNDLNIINLEAALTNSEAIVPKVFNFKATPQQVETLKTAHIEVVNIANNHILDYSENGLYETIETLDNAGIQHVGAGKNSDEARKPVIITKNGITIGILGCTDNEPTWRGGKEIPGTNYVKVGDNQVIVEDIKKLKEKVDVVILSVHWGPNMREHPPTHFQKFAHDLIDAGMDILHGHSAHIFQGIEIYENHLIMYDTGDFVDDYYVDPILRNDRSFLFQVEVNRQGFKKLNLVPTMIDKFQVNISTGKDKEETLERMSILSKGLNTLI